MIVDLEFLLFWWSAYLPLLSLSGSSRTYIPPATPIQPVGRWVGWLICGLFIPSSKAGIQMASLKTPALVCAVLSCFSCIWLSVTPWTVARQAPLSMGILQARILEWATMPSSRDLPDPEIEPRFPSLQADSLPGKPAISPYYFSSLNIGFPWWFSGWKIHLQCRSQFSRSVVSDSL